MGRHEKHAPFVAVNKQVLDSDAWRAMSMGARSLYIAIKRRYRNDRHNNGAIFLSQRDAAEELGRDTNQITRWYRELHHYGFVVQTKPGCLGLDGAGRAPHWRLTECGYMKAPPTQDYLRWDGVPFKTRRPKKQNPVRETTDAHMQTARASAKSRTYLVDHLVGAGSCAGQLPRSRRSRGAPHPRGRGDDGVLVIAFVAMPTL